MEQFTSRIEPSGRLLIPAVLRQRLGIKPGTEMILEEDNGVLHVHTRESALRRVQEYFASLDPGLSWSDEIIAEHRREAAREIGTP